MKSNLVLGALIFSAVAFIVIFVGMRLADDQLVEPLELSVKINQTDPELIAVDVLASEPADISASFTDKLAGTGRLGVIGQGRSYYDTRSVTIDLGRKQSYLSGKGKIVVVAKASDGRGNSTVLNI